MKYFITGNKGQLGSAFEEILFKRGIIRRGFDLPEADVADEHSVRHYLSDFKPDVVINCAAYNFVDKAEEDKSNAFNANGNGPAILGKVCKEIGAYLVTYGTDYVFDGKKNEPYTEKDSPNPLNYYGESKYIGEVNALEENPDKSLILRVSWVYGGGQQNFISKLVGWSRENEILRIADDEISVPTYTRTIANITLDAIENGLLGTYHLPNSGQASRLEWAKFIAEKLGLKNKIEPAKMVDFNLKARRPGYSVMSNESISKALGIEIPDWKQDCGSFLDDLK